MRQHARFKAENPGCVLFFRMGDFYEMFDEDAKLTHKVLGLTLTERTSGIPMAGIPFHSAEAYIRGSFSRGIESRSVSRSRILPKQRASSTEL